MANFIENSAIRYGVDELGKNLSFLNKTSGHEYIVSPSHVWKMILAGGQRKEQPVFAEDQTGGIFTDGKTLTIKYNSLIAAGKKLDISLTLTFTLEDSMISVTSSIENRSDLTVTELNITAASGIYSLNGNPSSDRIMWPLNYGKIIESPALSDLSVYSGFRKYERHDFLHTDLDLLYPGGAGSMPWYDLYSGVEGLYVASHGLSHETVCMHIERDVKTNLLSLGVIRYPFAEPGESWTGEPIVYCPHAGDWREGAHIYRHFTDSSGYFKAPELPEWVKNTEGWLRVILKPHHCEVNWDYKKIPELYDGAAAAGLDTIYLLGWEKGGFARMWPDFVADDNPEDGLGTEKELREGIEYVHSKGGKVIMFLSYFLIDHKSDFYLKEGGNECTIKSVWDEEVPFAETYCGEGTYRKLPNPPMPMYGACPGSGKWHVKMKAVAAYCMNLGCDGVLYDLGGLKPYLCFSDKHDHKKPNLACAGKADRFGDLRRVVKSYGDEKIILMEHIVDCFNQHMDIVHGSRMYPESKSNVPDMYRYTFPEVVMTNRELGEDEEDFRYNINFTFIYGLAFDMTIYRCCGSMADVPEYADYMKKIISLRRKYAKYLHLGKFIGDDCFTVETGNVRAKAYRAADGSVGVALWNRHHEPVEAVIRSEAGIEFRIGLEADGAGFVEIGNK